MVFIERSLFPKGKKWFSAKEVEDLKQFNQLKSLLFRYPEHTIGSSEVVRTVVEREPDNWYHSSNGGDYHEGYDIVDLFCVNWSSCEMTPDDYFATGGYLFGVPVIVEAFGYDHTECQIRFSDDSFFKGPVTNWCRVSQEVWDKVKGQFEEVCSSSWGIFFLNNK